MSLKVYSECCKNCLLSENRIVSPARAKRIIKDCVSKQSYFVCHKASMKDEEVICRNFYKQLGGHSQMVRIAERLNCLEFVEQPDSEKLPTWKEMKPVQPHQGYDL